MFENTIKIHQIFSKAIEQIAHNNIRIIHFLVKNLLKKIYYKHIYTNMKKKKRKYAFNEATESSNLLIISCSL